MSSEESNKDINYSDIVENIQGFALWLVNVSTMLCCSLLLLLFTVGVGVEVIKDIEHLELMNFSVFYLYLLLGSTVSLGLNWLLTYIQKTLMRGAES